MHPELVRTPTEPFPAEGAAPGDPDYMPDDEFARHWASLQSRMGRIHAAAPARVIQFWRAAAALAAMVVVALGVLLWQANARLSEPRLISEEQILFPDGRRGPAGQATTVTAEGESVMLVIPLIGRSEFTPRGLPPPQSSAVLVAVEANMDAGADRPTSAWCSRFRRS